MSDRKPTWVCTRCGATYGSNKGTCDQLVRKFSPEYGYDPYPVICNGLLVRDVELTEEQLEAMKGGNP